MESHQWLKDRQKFVIEWFLVFKLAIFLKVFSQIAIIVTDQSFELWFHNYLADLLLRTACFFLFFKEMVTQ